MIQKKNAVTVRYVIGQTFYELVHNLCSQHKKKYQQSVNSSNKIVCSGYLAEYIQLHTFGFVFETRAFLLLQ